MKYTASADLVDEAPYLFLRDGSGEPLAFPLMPEVELHQHDLLEYVPYEVRYSLIEDSWKEVERYVKEYDARLKAAGHPVEETREEQLAHQWLPYKYESWYILVPAEQTPSVEPLLKQVGIEVAPFYEQMLEEIKQQEEFDERYDREP